VATFLALVATFALVKRQPWALAVVWVLNICGAGDLFFAIYQGQIGVGIEIGMFGAAFFIPTVVVPALLVSHGLIFMLLVRRP
jgi:hypothetical protein